MNETMPLLQGLKIGNRFATNRIAINAMECCDADTEGNPTETSYRRYEELFKGNAGVIIVEALSVIDECRGRLHQLTALPQNQAALAKFVRAMKAVNDKPIMLWQLTHSGELSHPAFSKRVCVKPLPGYEGELLTEEEVDDILDKFVLAAKMAHDCGADGIDFKLCHGYFCSQLLRPYNDRPWKYGGSWGNRTRFVYEAYERIAAEVNDPNFLLGSKISVWEGIPGGMGTVGPDSPIIDLTEILDLVKGLESRGAVHRRIGRQSLYHVGAHPARPQNPGLCLSALLVPEIGSASAQAGDGAHRLGVLGLPQRQELLPRRARRGSLAGLLGKQEHPRRGLRHDRHRQAVAGRSALAGEAAKRCRR